MKTSKDSRKPDGATLALVICTALLLIVLGTGIFYISQTFLGSKQLDNATDAGALAAARSLLSIGLTTAQITHTDASGNLDTIPQQFKLCCFDSNGNPATYLDASGNPANAGGTISNPCYNINGYNEACGIVATVCLNAALSGAGSTAVTNANALANCLTKYSNDLIGDLLTSSIPATAFANLASSNCLNILPTNTLFGQLFGQQPTCTALPFSLQLGCTSTAQGAANIYLPASYTAQFTSANQQKWLKSLLSTVPANVSGTTVPYLLLGGATMDTTQWTDASGTNLGLTAQFTAVPFDLNQSTHLVVAPSSPTADNGFTATLPDGTQFSGTYNITPSGQYYFASSDSNGMNQLLSLAGSGQTVTITNPGNNNSYSFSVSGAGTGGWSGSVQISPAPGSPGTLYNHYMPPYYTSSNPTICPWNTVRVMSTSTNSSDSSTGQKGSLTLNVLSAAVFDTLQQFQVSIPHAYVRIINSQGFVGAMDNAGYSAATLQNTPSGLAGANPKTTNYYYSNVELKPNGLTSNSMNLSYDSTRTMFDVFSFGNPTNDGRNFVVIGCNPAVVNGVLTNSSTGVWDKYKKYLGSGSSDQDKITAWCKAAMDRPDNIPATNYATNGVSVVDDSVLAANAAAGKPANPGDNNPPSMPFNWDTLIGFGNTQTHPVDTIDSFTAWIEYVRSKGNDKLGHDYNKDPARALAQHVLKKKNVGSPELYAFNPHYECAGYSTSTLAATSGVYGPPHFTIGDAIQLSDMLILTDSAYILTTVHPQWIDAALPIISAHYNLPYLATPTANSSLPGFSAIQYAKAQVTTLFAGYGMTVFANNPQGLPAHPGEANGDVLPSSPGAFFLPMNPVTNSNPSPLVPGTTVCSGMEDFVGPPSSGFGSWPPGNPATNPYSGLTDATIQGNNQNLLVHRSWDMNAATVSAFSQIATPIQLMYDINVLANAGTFVPTDSNFQNIMNALLKAVQSMNPSASFQMQDVVNVLSNPAYTMNTGAAPDNPPNSPTTGEVYYLSVNNSTNKLQLSTTPPAGDNNVAADGTGPIQYWATYEVAGGAAPSNDSTVEGKECALKTLVDTAYGGAPNGPNSAGFGGWSAALGPVPDQNGDNSTHEAVYRHIGQLNSPGNYIYAEDMMQWTPGSTAGPNSCNLGDLQFYESIGPRMEVAKVN